MCIFLHVPCGEWQFTLPSETEEKYSPHTHYNLQWDFFFFMRLEEIQTSPHYCGN